MSDKALLGPAEIAEAYLESGPAKVARPALTQFLLAILGGAFIAFAAEGSNVAIHTIASVGLGKALAGALFATGLMLVVVAGADLFTGNVLLLLPLAARRVGPGGLLRNWILVYAGNLAGSLLVAGLILASGQLGFSGGLLGGFTIKVAAYKTGLHFLEALSLGILCNWLVCLAVWMAAGARDMAGKLLAIFFPIWLFITSGFEHSVANMYYIPAGILAARNPAWVQAALGLGLAPEKLAGLTWEGFFLHNLVPVTLGNILGGGLFVALAYWEAYLRGKRA